jgi:dihydropteroate synthase
MQIKPVYLSSKSKTLHYQNKYKLDPNLFWQGQYVFEIYGYSLSQHHILNSIYKKTSSLLTIHKHSELKSILVHFFKRDWSNEILIDLLVQDNEINAFFKQVHEFFSDINKPIWNLRGNRLNFNKSPFIMGILNVTPDSFSDGGKFSDINEAVDHALSMIEAGADIIDIGGESTRPGSDPVNLQEELNRVIPVIETIRIHSGAPLSIDTYKSEVAEAAIKAGANIVNDISGCTFDKRMPEIIQTNDVPIIIMHIKGTPKHMQSNPHYDDVCLEVYSFLSDQINYLSNTGIENIAVDPGIGFGKRLEDNLKLLNNLESLKFLCQPILIGASRKSFLGHVLDKEVDQRLYGSLSVAILSAIKGADIIRVHDVAETKDVLRIIDAIHSAE